MRYLEIAASKKRSLNWDAVRDVPMPGVMVYDMRNLPMKGVDDNTYDGVYNEHFIEHLEKDEGINLFKEMFRIMKPGGVIRTVWPSMDFVDFLRTPQDLSEHPFVHHYYNFYVVKHKFAPPGNERKSMQEQCALGLLHQNGEHKHLWYKQEMVDNLKQIGYNNVKECVYQKSGVAEFNNIDTPGQIRALHSAVIEATKPY
jgi:predicted SAM-dependent methyltransferase|tara:strand:+ start:3920 stop:4519 length:600 start_codon:yes stop_codon:yes gene_type:complete